MHTVFKHLWSDPAFVSFYYFFAGSVIVCILLFLIASRYFTAKRNAALRMNEFDSVVSNQVTLPAAPAGQTKPQSVSEPQETKDKVWWSASTVPADNICFKVLEPELELRESIARRTKPLARGEPIEDAIFPRKIVHSAQMDPSEIMTAPGQRLPYFFYHNYFCIAHDAIDIFLEHDLGDAQFRDVEFYEFGGNKRVGERLKILVPCNPKNGLLLDESPEVKGAALSTGSVVASYMNRHGDIAVSRSVLDGPDVWIDPGFASTFFLSDKLAQALMKAGIADDFDLRWARVL